MSSGDFLKSRGRFTETALRELVMITHHGRDRLVLLSAGEYRRLKDKDRTPLYAWELSDSDLLALGTSEPPAWAAGFDHEIT